MVSLSPMPSSDKEASLHPQTSWWVEAEFTSQISHKWLDFLEPGPPHFWWLLSCSWPAPLISTAGHLGRQNLLSLIAKTGVPMPESTKTPSKQLSRTRSWSGGWDDRKALEKKPVRTEEEAWEGEGHSWEEEAQTVRKDSNKWRPGEV